MKSCYLYQEVIQVETSIMEQKAQLRKQIQARRSTLTTKEHAAKSRAICQNLLKSRLLLRPDASRSNAPLAIMTYMPLGSEVDITPLMEWGWAQNHNIIVPRVVTGSHEMNLDRGMTLHQITSYDDLEAGTWGIREPKKTVPIYEDLSLLDVMLIPGIAFDRNGGRIGYGRGYYDRLLERFPEHCLQIPIKIALAFDLQLVSDIPMEKHDFRVDRIVTEFTIL